MNHYCSCCYALSLSRIWLLVTPWTVARQASLAMGLPRQEFWSGLLFPPPEDLIDPGLEPCLLHWRWILYHHESSWITIIQFKWSYENTVPFVLLHVFRLFFHLSFKYLVSISLTPPCHLSLCTLAEPIFLLLWPPSLTDSSSSSGSTCAWLALSPLLQVTYPSSGLPWGLWWLSLSIVSQFCGC